MTGISPLIVVSATSLYLLLIFLAGYYAHLRKTKGRGITDNPLVYSLSITVYTTTWTFYGSIGKAATTGLDFILIYLGPSLVAFSWWFILRKSVRIAKEQNVTSIADFLSSRYGKSQVLGALITVICLLGIMPYIALQLKAISTSFAIITGNSHLTARFGVNYDLSHKPGLLAAIVLSLLSIIFGARKLISSERHEGLMAALAIESAVKLVTFLIVGGFITYSLFNGFTDIFSRFSTDYPLTSEKLLTFGTGTSSSFTTVATMLILSMSAVMLLPRQFHAMVIENSSEEHIRQAMWRFPLYLFLINIFVIPVALAGIIFNRSSDGADFFILTLPLQNGHPWLALLAFLGGFSAAAGMVMVESIAIATMFLNHIIMPIIVRLKPRNCFPLLLINLKRLGIVVVVFLGFLYQLVVGDTYMLVNMGMISFSAAAQFAPSMLGALYWKRGNSTGAITGISLGFTIWGYTLLLPSLIRSGVLSESILNQGFLGIGLLKPLELFGLSGLDIWTHSLFWSMFFNIAGYLVCSIIFQQSEMESEQAKKFADVFVQTDSSRRWEKKRLTKPVTIMQLVNLMSKFIGEEQATTAIADYIGDREIDERGGVSEFEMPNLKRFVEKTLAGSVGTAAAGAIVESYLTGVGSQMESFYDIFSNVRSSLAESREALYVRLRASEIMNRSLDIQTIMDDLLELLQHELKFDCLLIRLTDSAHRLEIKAKCGIPEETLINSILNPEITSYTGDAFLSNKPQFVNDSRNITKVESRRIIEHEGIKSFAHIPLSQAGEPPLGVISVFSKSISGIFTEPLIELLSSLAGQLAQAIRIVNEKMEKEAERAEKELVLLENARVNRDMELARQIQLSLLPSSYPEKMKDSMSAICIPAAHVGGDYYDFYQPDQHQLNMVIADVSGHNVGAALIMVETKGVFRLLASGRKMTAETLAVLNRQLYQDLSSSELFISMFYAKYNFIRKILTYSNAGHNRPFVVRANSGECIELDAEGLLLGIIEKVEFEQKEIELYTDDILLLYTDGVVEAESAEGDFFGDERLKNILINNREESTAKILDIILNEVKSFAGKGSLADDVSLVLLKMP